ncbi:hypothetical protein GBA52_028499 [Prunus armeniaca]|nr:hypothetical protein GBA52_028499 [Prunus armeniaca]
MATTQAQSPNFSSQAFTQAQQPNFSSSPPNFSSFGSLLKPSMPFFTYRVNSHTTIFSNVAILHTRSLCFRKVRVW